MQFVYCTSFRVGGVKENNDYKINLNADKSNCPSEAVFPISFSDTGTYSISENHPVLVVSKSDLTSHYQSVNSKHTSLNYAQNFMLNLLCKKYAFYKLLKQNVSFLEVENQLSCIIYAIWGNMRPGGKSTKTCICMPRKDLTQRKPYCKFLLPKLRKSISISLALFLVSVYFRKTLAEDSPESCWVWETGSWKAKGRMLCGEAGRWEMWPGKTKTWPTGICKLCTVGRFDIKAQPHFPLEIFSKSCMAY